MPSFSSLSLSPPLSLSLSLYTLYPRTGWAMTYAFMLASHFAVKGRYLKGETNDDCILSFVNQLQIGRMGYCMHQINNSLIVVQELLNTSFRKTIAFFALTLARQQAIFFLHPRPSCAQPRSREDRVKNEDEFRDSIVSPCRTTLDAYTAELLERAARVVRMEKAQSMGPSLTFDAPPLVCDVLDDIMISEKVSAYAATREGALLSFLYDGENQEMLVHGGECVRHSLELRDLLTSTLNGRIHERHLTMTIPQICNALRTHTVYRPLAARLLKVYIRFLDSYTAMRPFMIYT
ncbi:hypothetical protein KIPB_008462 [Kipferlia bialata]|uniref:Uncharacterized protein n=1 Tax=Kipferlia bialata TaxID=797122 RepID=A0A9K3D0Q8_9EUKA|nr:hypothetical protein KIPB_008462 [Kipferlia bialata]|eukprot:g8462.t1